MNVYYDPPQLSVESLGSGFLDNIVDAGTRVTLAAMAIDPNQPNNPSLCQRIQWHDTTNGIVHELGRGCEVVVPGFRPGQNSIGCSVSTVTGQVTSQTFTLHALNGEFLNAPLVHIITPTESVNGRVPQVRWNESVAFGP